MQTASFQEIQGIQLLSLHKPASPEGHNFCEGEFLFQELTGENPEPFCFQHYSHVGIFFIQKTGDGQLKHPDLFRCLCGGHTGTAQDGKK